MSILDLSFNQPTTHLSVCTEFGEIVYSLNPVFEKQFKNDRGGGVGLMRMYGKTNIMCLVGAGNNGFTSKDIFKIWDDKIKKYIYDVSMNEPIKNIRMMDDKIIVSLNTKINVFNFKNQMSQIGYKITYPNTNGLCVVSHGKDFTIATLGSNKGEIALWKLSNDSLKVISAHKNNIDALAINADGSLVATASETGTLIKIFSTSTCELRYEFRRGSSSAKINDLSFSKDSNLLACSSANGTVHLFELYNDSINTKNTQSSLSGFKDYLPKYFSSQWSFKQIYIGTNAKTICSFDEDGSLHVAALDGKYFKIFGKEYENITNGNIDINNG